MVDLSADVAPDATIRISPASMRSIRPRISHSSGITSRCVGTAAIRFCRNSSITSLSDDSLLSSLLAFLIMKPCSSRSPENGKSWLVTRLVTCVTRPRGSLHEGTGTFQPGRRTPANDLRPDQAQYPTRPSRSLLADGVPSGAPAPAQVSGDLELHHGPRTRRDRHPLAHSRWPTASSIRATVAPLR